MKNVDFGLTDNDYAKHRQGFPKQFFEKLAQRGIGKPGQHVLDLGTGTGTIARGIALQGAKVTAIDISEQLIAKAKQLDHKANVAVEYHTTSAEKISFAQNTFDHVTAGQCWHWFQREKVAQKIYNILKPNGSLIIAHFDWLPIKGNVVEMTEKLIEKYNQEWHLGGGTGVYPQWFIDVARAHFSNIESYTFDLDIPYSHADWRGRIRASAGVGASLESSKINAFDDDLQQSLQQYFPQDPLLIPHRIFTLICCKPSYVNY